MDASFFSKPLSQLECRDNKKSCHLLEKKGTHPMRMHDNNTTCNRSNAIFQTPTAIQPISIQLLQTQQKPCVTETWRNAEKHSLLVMPAYWKQIHLSSHQCLYGCLLIWLVGWLVVDSSYFSTLLSTIDTR